VHAKPVNGFDPVKIQGPVHLHRIFVLRQVPAGFAVIAFSRVHPRRLRTSNPLERVNQ
jgi:hypothetical protein